MKLVTVCTPTHRRRQPKANFLVYPDPNHLGEKLSKHSALSCEQPPSHGRLSLQKCKPCPNRRGKAQLVLQPPTSKK